MASFRDRTRRYQLAVFAALVLLRTTAALCQERHPEPPSSLLTREEQLDEQEPGTPDQSAIEAPQELSEEEQLLAGGTSSQDETAPHEVPLPPVEYEDEAPSLLARISARLFSLVFFDIAFGSLENEVHDRAGVPLKDEEGRPVTETVPIPLLIFVLAFGAVFFTLYHRFVNFRGFRHAIDIVRGRYDREEDTGEITHFRALTSALSATIGLGNIAGVAIAIQVGGPGAVFWMLVLAFFGMTSKFHECTLAQLYRQVNRDGSISGGPMYYLDLGLRERGPGFAALGKVLGVTFALMVMGGAIGGGNMFQANQTVEVFVDAFQLGERAPLVIGLILAALVAVVILGGIKRIGMATSRIVPFMCLLYIAACLIVIVANIDMLPHSLRLIGTMAFTGNAFFGGLVGVIVKGIQRAAFSNEAGLGSAAIAHAAAKTDEPVREGLVGMLGPFIDTVVVCLMTSLVVIITGAWENPAALGSSELDVGVSLTSYAFSTVLPGFSYVLAVSIALFAYSTMVSWCYYGERGWIYLLDHFNGAGLRTVVVFRIVFVACVVVGAVNELRDVLNFADAMILSMAFPNIIGGILLARRVAERREDYWKRLRAGAFDR